MRLWSLHPQYLDPRGLVALWREALLAQAVLAGQTRGYRRHPQLTRFRETAAPLAAIAAYLRGIHAEAARRGYRFEVTRIGVVGTRELIAVTDGQMAYEWAHLTAKLRLRAPGWLAGLAAVSAPAPHPLFCLVPGPVAGWEMVAPPRRDTPVAADKQ